MFPYKTYRNYLKKRFGGPVFKVPINGGFSCPHKEDGNGCHFCDNVTFSPAAKKAAVDVVDQLTRAIERNKRRYNNFLPYLQPNTNTYGTLTELKEIYEPLLAADHCVGLAIGTRPDCFSEEIYAYLEEISQRTYLSVELGLQSSSNKTLTNINRGHDFESFKVAVNRLHSMGIEVVTHLMAGLPGETVEDMVQTVRNISALPIGGVKFHQLMVIRGTAFAKQYEEQLFDTLSLERYAEILGTLLEHTRKDILIHRIMADTPRHNNDLISPLWSYEKDSSVQWLQKYLIENNVQQGRLFK